MAKRSGGQQKTLLLLAAIVILLIGAFHFVIRRLWPQNELPEADFRATIDYGESFEPLEFHLYGAVPVFCQDPTCLTCQQLREIRTLVKSSIVAELGLVVRERVFNMFPPHVTQNSLMQLNAFQVSCLPTVAARPSLFCAFRVWLNTKDVTSSNRNRYQDSFLYTAHLDEHFNFTSGSGHIVNIPTPIQESQFTGPEDPRVFSMNGSVFINFINAHAHPDLPVTLRHQFLWSVSDKVLYDISVDGFSLNHWEKNWSPWVIDDSLYFVYQFLPTLRILKCHLEHGKRLVNCSFVTGKPNDSEMNNMDGLRLRGGSPLVHYADTYYLAITHSVQQAFDGRVYAAQICLVDRLSFRIVFLSSPIFIDKNVMNSIRMTENVLKRPFIYARSVLLESPDSILFAAGVNDNGSFLIRLEGIAPLLEAAIRYDQAQNPDVHLCSNETYHAMEHWLVNKNIAQVLTNFP